MSPRILHCPRCGAPIEDIEGASVTCKFCGSRVSLDQAPPARPADARPAQPVVRQEPPSPFWGRFRVVSGVVFSAIGGWAVVQSAYAFFRNGSPQGLSTALLAGLAVIGAAALGRKVPALVMALWSGALLAAKPFIRPVFMKDGDFFSSTSETHLNYLVPGVLLLVTAALLVMSMQRARDKAKAKAMTPVLLSLNVAALVAGATVTLASLRGETTQDVIDRYRPRFEAVRRSLRTVAEKLPPAGGAPAEPGRANLSPPPVFDEVKPTKTNTLIVAPEQLVDPDAKVSHDLLLSSDLAFALAWTGPKNPMSDSALYDRAGGFGDTLERALAYRYVVVYRPAGADGLEAFVFDLRSTNLVATTAVKGAGGYVQGRKHLTEALTRATGGTFLLR